ncbi:hypothetical protein WISP_12783 [Willisornis vidua]|uniref:Uncharacterized protein n=1 Tax=Willisornis vidua TaxID=1566151 RepID=A0ABQ9DQS0_9PASS|nr:hypothetical protein WISP_12783 [Willisornis vidua]
MGCQLFREHVMGHSVKGFTEDQIYQIHSLTLIHQRNINYAGIYYIYPKGKQKHKEELASLIYKLEGNFEDAICHWQYWLFNWPSSYLLPSSTPFPTQEKELPKYSSKKRDRIINTSQKEV